MSDNSSDNAGTPQSDTGGPEQRAEFARVFAQHDRWLYAYLVTLLGSPAHAEEVFQEVCVVLWRECHKFDPRHAAAIDSGANSGSESRDASANSFVKWASVVAHNQVRNYRRKLGRDARRLSDEAVELLAEDAVEQSDLMEHRRTALHGCLQKLSESDRQLVGNCYGESEVSIKSVAAALGRPANTVYKALARIRRALQHCIQARLASEGIQ